MKTTRHILAVSLATISSLVFPQPAVAHCPLCTLGVGAAAVGAGWLGVEKVSIGVFVGAFSVALGFWIANSVPKVVVPFQKQVVTSIIVLTTLLPLIPILTNYTSIYVQLGGSYGSLLNRTYPINLFLVGSLIGILVLVMTPDISKWISQQRGDKMIPYQGVALTLILLTLMAAILQVLT
jgi:hypothetical protein